MPVKIIHDGVLSRSVRDTAAFVRESERVYRDLEAASGGRRHRAREEAAADRAGHQLDRRPGDRRRDRAAVLHTAGLLEELGHTIEAADAPVPDTFEDDFLLYWSLLALFLSTTGKRTFNRTYDRSLNDNLTKGLARHAARNSWRLPLAIARLTSPAASARSSSPTTTWC